MITEDYVSFETAKLLKEKGFNVETEHKMWYVIKQFSTGCHWNSCIYKEGDITREHDKDYCIAMPTLQMARKWLLEKHKLYIEIRITNHSMSNLIDIPKYYWVLFDATTVKWLGESTINKPIAFDSPEEGYEEAIKYCLKNLV